MAAEAAVMPAAVAVMPAAAAADMVEEAAVMGANRRWREKQCVNQ
jgi:hypothetical protein